jgi:hypothetical protein
VRLTSALEARRVSPTPAARRFGRQLTEALNDRKEPSVTKAIAILLFALMLAAIVGMGVAPAVLAGWLVVYAGAPTWVGVSVGIAVFLFVGGSGASRA